MSFPASLKHDEPEESWTQPHKKHFHLSESIKPQAPVLTVYSHLHPRADQIPKPEARQRSSSLGSNSSEEVIVFRGRERAAARTPKSTDQLTSFVKKSGSLSRITKLTSSNNPFDSLLTTNDCTFNSSQSASPHDASSQSPFFEERDWGTKGGYLVSDISKPKSPARNINPPKYQTVPDFLAKPEQIDENDSAIAEQLSNLSEVDPAQNGVGGIATKKDSDPLIESTKNIDKHTPNHQMCMRRVNTADMIHKPRVEIRAKLLGLDSATLHQATDDGDEHQGQDESSLSNVYLRRSRVAPEAEKIRTSEKSNLYLSSIPDENEIFDYGEFDIMDRQRPSIQSRGKKKHRHLPLEPNNSDLERSMQLTWEGDRMKKKLRKQAREELRQLGLLDKKSKVRLNPKYPQDLLPGDAKEQIKVFLQSPQAR